ncbi:hypothetical protein ACP275_08G114600 [Erythranthe tilingii]
MSYMSKLWMATSVAAVNSHSNQGQKLKSALKSFNIGGGGGNKRFFSGHGRHEPAELRSCSAVRNSDVGVDRRKQADESVHQVMYFNCWGQG